jgi:tRNA(Ile)-lysidine synthase
MSIINEYLKRLTEYVKQEQLVKNGEKLLLAVSAGADSTAMLYLFSCLRFRCNFSLLAVHINHRLRGGSSDLDEQHIKNTCMRLSVPLIIRRIDISGAHDLENRARLARFEVFNQILESYRFGKVLLAHHKWDLAETVLLNLFRGSGLGGMAGIKPKAGNVAHPMLAFTPLELRDLLLEAGISWREDESNLDNRFTRNRVRNELMPHLAEAYNPQIREKLADEAAILLQADQYIAAKAARKFKRIGFENGRGRVILSLPDLRKAQSIEQYYVLRKAFSLVSGSQQDFFGCHLRELVGLIEAEGSKHISLPRGVFAIKRYQELHFSLFPEDVRAPVSEALVIDGERARAVHMDYRFSFRYLKVLPPDHIEIRTGRVILDADKIMGKIRIRGRADGDRFIPFGMRDFKKLKDFFIDEKVAKYDRDLIPIFEDDEKIFWICGYRIDDRVRYTESTSRFLMIEAESLLENPNRAASRKKRGTNELDEL